MKGSLYRKFIIGFAVAGLVAFFAVTIFADVIVRYRLEKAKAAEMTVQAESIAEAITTGPEYLHTVNDMSSGILKNAADVSGVNFWLVSPAGKITFDSAGANDGATIDGFDPSLNTDYLNGSFSGLLPAPVIAVISPVTISQNIIGYVIVTCPETQITAEKEQMIPIIYLCCGIVFAACLTMLIVFHFSVYRPLTSIQSGAREFAKGNLSYRIPTRGPEDEMTYLAETLNFMAEEQSNLEKYQRDFVSNVSHDFRSPLTSIKGFLEAILDGTIPAELHEKYIRRVIGETERLTKLTEEMLTLGNDSRGMIRRTRFDINAAVKRVCASYENECMKKELTFELLFEEPAEFVTADQDKINRVLYNLIDNAIKFSYPGTAITVSTAAKQKKVYVSVKDHGEGIPKASLKKIWDRFYKTDTSRGKDKKGTGLGLSIVKEIISAHGENIDVVSTEKVGTTFTFTLPQAE